MKYITWTRSQEASKSPPPASGIGQLFMIDKWLTAMGNEISEFLSERDMSRFAPQFFSDPTPCTRSG